MKLSPFFLIAIGAFLIQPSLTQAAYMEGGKPVTKRNEIKTHTETPVKAEKQHPSEVSKKVPQGKVPDKASQQKATPLSQPKETPPSKPAEKQPLPQKKQEPPPPKAQTPKPLPLEERPETRPLEKSPKKDTSSSLKTTEPLPVPHKPKVQEEDRDKNAFLLTALGGRMDLSDGYDAELFGISLEYRRTLADSRCDSCGLGNRLIFSLKGSYAAGENEDKKYRWYWGRGYYRYSYKEASQLSVDGGLLWQHQLSKKLSTVAGGFIGYRYTSADCNIFGDYYANGYYYYGERTLKDSAGELCYGGCVGLNYEFTPGHFLELGAEISASKTELNLPRWEKRPFSYFVKLSYGFSF